MTHEERETVEKSLIGAIFLDSQRCLPMAINAGVKEDWFSIRSLQLAWFAMRVLFSEKAPVDAITVSTRAHRLAKEPKSAFADTDVYAGQITACIDAAVSSANFEYYLSLARSEVMIRRVAKAQQEMQADLKHGLDIPNAVANLSKRIIDVLAGSMGAKVISVRDVCVKIEAEYEAAHKKRVDEKDLEYTPGLPLPWKAFNLKSQGVQEGLYYVGARPSVGKTAFALNLVRYWCEHGIKVTFNSLDMAVKPFLKRPIGELSRVSLAKASFGATTNADLQSVHDAIWGATDLAGVKLKKGVAEWDLNLICERDIEAFRSWCVAMKQAGKMDVVIIDFVQLMTCRGGRFANDNERLEYISGVLKSIAIDLEMPVIALSQLNRACEEDGGRVPTASDLRGSGALEQDATAIWILHSEKNVVKKWNDPNLLDSRPMGLTVNFTNPEFRGIKPVRLIIAKNQNGAGGQDIWLPFILFAKYCLFMLGDVDAEPIVRTVGYGVSAKTDMDYEPMYRKVTSDWRTDPFEDVLRSHHSLVEGK
jgi:replicative DNA helicase